MHDIHIYSKSGCINCQNIEQILSINKLQYTKSIHHPLFDLLNECNIDEEKLIDIGAFPILKYKNKYLSYYRSLQFFDEKILIENNNRFSLYPVKYHDIFDMFFESA